MGTFAFIQHQRGEPDEPVAYDPCRKIEYAVNGRLGPANGDQVIERAVSAVSRATGLVFDRVADTDRVPVQNADRFGTLREPVVIGWTTPDVVTELAGDTAGMGGSSSYTRAAGEASQYVTGIVALDAPQLLGLGSRPGGRADVEAIVLHELGHLVGLAHVDDAGELMFEDNVGRLDFGPGDREGLAALGSGACFP